jgi:hypothetical protein
LKLETGDGDWDRKKVEGVEILSDVTVAEDGRMREEGKKVVRLQGRIDRNLFC